MIKILLADDEKIIKQGLKENIDWASLGAEVCGEAADGKEALELIAYHKPQIVISDIKMPYMTGLEMMQEARKLDPELFVLFISGHDEFSYVQKALKLGAADYILKPIDPVYLQERLADIIASIDQRNEEQHALQASKAAQLRQFLQTIILNGADSTEIRQNPLSLCEELTHHWFSVLSLQIDLYYRLADELVEQDVNLHRREFYHLADLFEGVDVYRISETLSSYELCIASTSQQGLKERINTTIASIREKTDTLGFTVTIGVSNPVSGLSDLQKSFTEAQEAMEMKFVKGGNSTYHARDYQVYRETFESGGDIPDTSELIQVIREGDADRLEAAYSSIRDGILQSEQPRRTLHWFSSDILLQVIKILAEREFSIEEIIDDPLEEWEKLGKSQTVDSFSKRFLLIMGKITGYIAKRRDYHASQILDQAISYVKDHYTENSLSLDDVSAEAGMSPCYFSVIFKQQTGKTFNRYLTDLRINKAKDLILFTDDKSYEIGPKVGYDNPSYFSTVFKKTTGMSPTEYKKRFS